jgi:plasmid stabilization system protein ParE
MNPRLLPEAADDVAEIVNYLNQQPSRLGAQFRAELFALIANLCIFPRLYNRAPRAPRRREVRMAYLWRFQRKVYSEVAASEIVVLSVMHARSNSRAWRRRLVP